MADTPAAPHTHHWIVTLQWSDTTASYRGTLTPPAGKTRAEVCEEIITRVVDSAERADEPQPAILFFALEPNDLSVVASSGSVLRDIFRDRR